MTQTWLITGSSRGLGRALAEAVLDAGHNLVATARRPEQVQDLVDRYPDRARAVALDVTDRAAAASAIQAAVDAFGRLDVLVNNAGYANVSSIEDFDEADFRAQLETNLWGVINVTRAALPVLREQRSGHVIQVSSVGGRVTSAGIGPYQTAKWAVEGFSGVLAKEVAPLGIKVTIIEPGGFRTDWGGSSMQLADVHPDYEATVGEMHRRRLEMDGKQPGDPVRAAQAILQVVALDNPPLRLLLGTDALTLADTSAKSRAAEAEAWAHLTTSTDFA